MDERSPGRPRPALLWGGAAAAVVIGLSAFIIGVGSGARAAGPERPYKRFIPVVAHDESPPTPTPVSTPAPPPTSVPAPTAGEEINLQPQLDDAHAVSKLVTYAAGGTLTTTGADGSRYTLTLPAHSVLLDVVVTMTPLKAVGGLPASGGLKAGVQLEPDGLALDVPATLDIVSARPVAPADEISFSYDGDGQQAYAYGLDVNASRTRFEILHFSGWAIAGGTDGERTAFFQSKVDSVASQFRQDFAAALAAERARQAAAGSPSDGGSLEFQVAINAVVAQSYTTLVIPAMDTAEDLANAGAIDAVEPGLQAMHAWSHEIAVGGIGDQWEDEQAALRQQEIRILDKVRSNMRDRCFRMHEVKWGSRLYALARRLQFWSESVSAQAFEDARRCLTFKLDFETSVVVGQAGLTAWEYRVRTVGVPVIFGDFYSATEVPPVTQPLELLSFGAPRPTCAFDGSGVHPTAPFMVTNAKLVPVTQADVKDKAANEEVKNIELTIQMGDLAGSVGWICKGGYMGPYPLPDGGIRGMFNSFHISEFGPGGIVIKDWELVRGDIYAVKLYSQRTALGQEDTILELRHAPE